MAAGAVGDKTERKKYEFFLLKAIIAGMLRDDENFLHRVRNAGSKHPFLHGMPKEGPASAEAVDRFHWFLMPILAQFAADGIPAHGVFKATMINIAKTHAIFAEGTRVKVIKDWSGFWARPRIHSIKDWSGFWAGQMRSMCVHAMTLATRSESSRSENIKTLKLLVAEVTGGDANVEALYSTNNTGGSVSSSDQDLEALADEPVRFLTRQEMEDREDSQYPADYDWNSLFPEDATSTKSAQELEADCPSKSTEDELGPKLEVAPTHSTAAAPAAKGGCGEGRPEEARGALLPVPNRVDGSLAEQVKAMQEAAPHDDDLAAAQAKAAKAAKKRPVPKKGEGEDPDENADQEDEPPKEKKPRAAKSKAKKKTDTDDEEKPAPKRKSKTNDGKKTTRPAAAPESASKPPAEASTDDLWNEKEPALKAAQIPIPEGVSPAEAKSFTLKPNDATTQSSIGILWSKDQMYVSQVPLDEANVPKCGQEFLEKHKIKVNSNQGATLSVRKHQGWSTCFIIAKKVAMWTVD